MSHPSAQRLMNALEAEMGRLETTDGAASAAESKAWREHAGLLIQSRRAVLTNEACPPAYLRRVQGLFQSRAPALGLLRLVFDSWRSLQPAMRGTANARSLRYEGVEAAVDLRLVPETNAQILVQVAVEPACAGFSVEFSQSERSRPKKAALDQTGSAQVRLRRISPSVVVVVRDGKREVLRLPPVPLE